MILFDELYQNLCPKLKPLTQCSAIILQGDLCTCIPNTQFVWFPKTTHTGSSTWHLELRSYGTISMDAGNFVLGLSDLDQDFKDPFPLTVFCLFSCALVVSIYSREKGVYGLYESLTTTIRMTNWYKLQLCHGCAMYFSPAFVKLTNPLYLYCFIFAEFYELSECIKKILILGAAINTGTGSTTSRCFATTESPFTLV